MGAREELRDGRGTEEFGKHDVSLDVRSSVGSNLIGEDKVLGLRCAVLVEEEIVIVGGIVDSETPVGALSVHSSHTS